MFQIPWASILNNLKTMSILVVIILLNKDMFQLKQNPICHYALTIVLNYVALLFVEMSLCCPFALNTSPIFEIAQYSSMDWNI